jgi:hypothetical protein
VGVGAFIISVDRAGERFDGTDIDAIDFAGWSI